jgi:acid stress-induced BolA-like protein IbaG/YrbA
MGHHLTTFQGSVTDAIKKAIATVEGVTEAQVEVEGGGGHFTIVVTSPVFAGKSRLDSQRLVLGSIAHLMAGDGAPVHAVDSLKTKTP